MLILFILQFCPLQHVIGFPRSGHVIIKNDLQNIRHQYYLVITLLRILFCRFKSHWCQYGLYTDWILNYTTGGGSFSWQGLELKGTIAVTPIYYLLGRSGSDEPIKMEDKMFHLQWPSLSLQSICLNCGVFSQPWLQKIVFRLLWRTALPHHSNQFIFTGAISAGCDYRKVQVSLKKIFCIDHTTHNCQRYTYLINNVYSLQ